mmetsp:Transcript_26230/g.56756  ORF Transcript_26230/g.56756 Transcript_26230/m.56756 type:complete len:115 (-) Transcript_26230:11-355(-)
MVLLRAQTCLVRIVPLELRHTPTAPTAPAADVPQELRGQESQGTRPSRGWGEEPAPVPASEREGERVGEMEAAGGMERTAETAEDVIIGEDGPEGESIVEGEGGADKGAEAGQM